MLLASNVKVLRNSQNALLLASNWHAVYILGYRSLNENVSRPLQKFSVGQKFIEYIFGAPFPDSTKKEIYIINNIFKVKLPPTYLVSMH